MAASSSRRPAVPPAVCGSLVADRLAAFADSAAAATLDVAQKFFGLQALNRHKARPVSLRHSIGGHYGFFGFEKAWEITPFCDGHHSAFIPLS
jgi:hypothetical protein